MWFKSKLLTATLVVAAASTLTISQAEARDSDAAAVLVGIAVGGLTTYALQHAHEHHHRDYDRDYGYYEQREYPEPPRRHCPPRRVEHTVIYNPPQRDYDRVSYREEGHRRGGSYEYEREYERRGSF